MGRMPARELPLAGGPFPASAMAGLGGQKASPEVLATELTTLRAMDAATLRSEWRRLYRADPPPTLGRDLLELGVAWRLQELALGGLGANARRQLAELAGALAGGSDLPKARRTRLKPGARLVRSWGGQTHEVLVVEGGFLWRDRVWRSLSVIAREMTGTRWSGPRFFGLDRAGVPGRGGAVGEGVGDGAKG